MRKNFKTSNSPKPKSRGLQPARPFLSRRTVCVAERPRGLKPRGSLSPAFTLVELMVVIGIIALLLAITVPAIGPLLASNSMAEAQNTINGLLTTAQVQAEANVTPVAIRIERAFTMTETLIPPITGQPYEVMKKSGLPLKPEWLNHQQARFVIFASRQYQDATGVQRTQIFEQIPSSKVVTLPTGAWLAPDYALKWDGSPGVPNLAENSNDETSFNNLYQATKDTLAPNPVAFNRFENFYIAFNKLGELTQYSAAKTIYKDHTQAYQNPSYPPTPPVTLDTHVYHPDDSARGLLIYNRDGYKRFANTDAAGRLNYLKREARAVFLNKSMGSVVQEKQQ